MPAVSSTVGVIKARSDVNFPVDEVVSVSDSQGLVDNFYTPDTNTGAEDFYSAEGFEDMVHH